MPLAAAAIALILAALLVTLTGCASSGTTGAGTDAGSDGTDGHPGASDVAEFPSGSWLLTSMKDADGAVENPLPQPTLDIADRRVSGSGGCNGYNAPLVDDRGGAFELGPVVATKRACAEESANALEARYLAALDLVTGYVYEAEQLQLVGDGVTLTFAADPGGQAGPADE